MQAWIEFDQSPVGKDDWGNELFGIIALLIQNERDEEALLDFLRTQKVELDGWHSTDTQEQIDADAKLCAAEYVDSVLGMDSWGVSEEECVELMVSSLLKRQRQLLKAAGDGDAA